MQHNTPYLSRDLGQDASGVSFLGLLFGSALLPCRFTWNMWGMCWGPRLRLHVMSLQECACFDLWKTRFFPTDKHKA